MEIEQIETEAAKKLRTLDEYCTSLGKGFEIDLSHTQIGTS